MIRIKDLKIKVEDNSEKNLKKKIIKKLNISENSFKSFKINKKAIDARHQKEIFYVYELDVEVTNEDEILKKQLEHVCKTPEETYLFPLKKCSLTKRPIIVGSGPAGLFCAYFLSLNGLNPIIIERGETISKRVVSVEQFWERGELNENSNVQFGEGGAGTFSDGKLNTSIKDPLYRGKKVLDLFVSFGAPKEILYDSKPHIGTNKLRKVITKMREEIEKMGGEFRFQTELTNLKIENDKIIEIEVNHQEYIPCDILVLAIGHSARDTFELLYKNGLNIQSKPFAVGIRIEHNQEMINQSQYGITSSLLEPASYKLTYTTKDHRGVYSFCMCPGGYVVNASSEPHHLAINGMSNYERESSNSNSALLVTVTSKDFGDKPLDGIKFQRKLEEKAYLYGNGKIPTQRYEDFINNKKTNSYGKILPIHKGKNVLANLNELLPDYILKSLKEAMLEFGKKIKGFDDQDALLSVMESRSSSPIRIQRNETLESNIKGIYPCGEGSGYAGGIMTSAIDGIKVAENII